MEYGSVCIATLWVNKNSFSQHLACLSRHICVCVIVCVCAVPLVASSLAELPASCPICSSHMVFSFSGGTSLSPFLPYFSYLCSVCPCFDSSLHSSPPPLHLSHPLPSPECVCVLFFFIIPAIFLAEISTHLCRCKFILHVHVPAPSTQTGYHSNCSTALCWLSECALLLHHSLPTTLFYSLSFTLNYS